MRRDVRQRGCNGAGERNVERPVFFLKGDEQLSPSSAAPLFGPPPAQKVPLSHISPVDRDATGSTPLHWAARAGNGDVVHILTSAHHPLDCVNKDGETALHWALRTGVRGLNSARVLVEDGASTRVFNNAGRR